MRRVTGYDRFCQQANRRFFATALAVLRVGMGVMFLLAGVQKMGDWSAESYLMVATGPFADFFISLAGSPLVDFLNIWGLMLIGVALILGVMVRPASVFGTILMLLYYFAHFVQNTEYGFMNEHLMYVLVFVLFMAGGAGHVFGLDALVWSRQRRPSMWTRLFFG